MNQNARPFHLGRRDPQGCFGCLRTILFFGILAFFAYYGSSRLDQLNAHELAKAYRENHPLLVGWMSDPMLLRVIDPAAWRYMLAPLTAFVCVFLASAYFVHDVYALPNLNMAFRYIISSLFTLFSPRITIDKGRIPEDRFKKDLLQVVGGPGYAFIEPGSVAVFRHLREMSDAEVSTTHYMAPFERIALTVDLAEQQADIDSPIDATTRDGIRVSLSDVHYRYRIRQTVNGQPARRTLNQAFPFAEEDLRNLVTSLTVEKAGLASWNASVERQITGEITDFIAANTIDYLTAPKRGTQNPRMELNERLYTQVNNRLRSSGAELLWVDVGHIDIQAGEVDQHRSDVWAADWIGESKAMLEQSEATRQAYAELGRAQAQAEIILGIADALQTANLMDQPPITIRQLLLARTAQLLEALNNNARVRRG